MKKTLAVCLLVALSAYGADEICTLDTSECGIESPSPECSFQPVRWQYLCALYVDGSEWCEERWFDECNHVVKVTVEDVYCPNGACAPCMARDFAMNYGWTPEKCSMARHRAVKHGQDTYPFNAPLAASR